MTEMNQTTPIPVTTPGGEELVHLPRDEYKRLLEAAEDAADARDYLETKAAGIGQAYPSMLESGKREGSFGTWLKLADALGVPALEDLRPAEAAD